MKKRWFAAALGACAVLVLSGLASAAAPESISFEVNSTRIVPASVTGCGFDVVRHAEGTYYITTFYNPDGTVARQVNRVSSYKITYTNPLSGKSVQTVLAGPLVIEPNEDGTVTVTIPGNVGLFPVPGEGAVWSNVGRIVYLADPADPFTPIGLIGVNGRYTDFTSPYPEVCSGLL